MSEKLSIPQNELTPAQYALREYMFKLSEAKEAASWCIGFEYTMWGILVGDTDQSQLLYPCTPQELTFLSQCALEARGWFVYDIHDMDIPQPHFVKRDDWMRQYEQYKAEQNVQSL